MAEMIGRRYGILTAEQRQAMHETQQWVDENRPRLDREAMEHKAELDALIQAYRALKREREARGLSLADVAERSGIDLAYLSELDRDPYPSPPLSELVRIAEAIGVRLTIGVSGQAA